MKFTVSFPGGVMVDASSGSHTIRTDQPAPVGEDTAMAPFDLFLASIATCMGFYALRFCQQRDIDTAGLSLTLDTIREESGKRVETMKIALKLPAEFPEKYRDAMLRAVDHCAVKRAILEPPQFDIALEA